MKVGDRVEVRTSAGGGRFTGEVVEIDDHVAVIDPDSRDVRMFIGGEYIIGAAHWRSSVTILLPSEEA